MRIRNKLKDSTVPLEVRFWNRVNKDGPTHPVHGQCWVWTGPPMPNGYGLINVKCKSWYTHRCSYMLHFGDIPKGKQVCHRCDNKMCVNPDHLFLGSQNDNIQDCISKDRHSRGEIHYNAVLTDTQVIEIRRRYKPRCRINGASALGREFGVSGGTVWEIVTGKIWKHLLRNK